MSAYPSRVIGRASISVDLIHIGMMVPDNGLSIDEFIQQSPQLFHAQESYKYAAYDGLGNLSGHKLCGG